MFWRLHSLACSNIKKNLKMGVLPLPLKDGTITAAEAMSPAAPAAEAMGSAAAGDISMQPREQ